MCITIIYRSVIVINHIVSNKGISNGCTANKQKHFTFCKLQCIVTYDS